MPGGERLSRKNTKAEGDRWEVRIKQYMESIGFSVERAKPILKRINGFWISSSNDFFGASDHFCMKAGYDKLVFIQATTNLGQLSVKKKKQETVPWAPCCKVQIWIKSKSGTVRVFDRIGPMEYSEYIWRLKDGVEPPTGVL